jgi:hypothetical protein
MGSLAPWPTSHDPPNAMHVTSMSNNNHGVALPLRQSYGGTVTAPLPKRYRDPAPQSIPKILLPVPLPFARTRGPPFNLWR